MNPFERMQEAIVMDESVPVSQAVGKLARSDSCIIVTKGGKYVGILDDISAVEKTSDMTKTKIGSAMRSAPLVENGASLLEICKAFFNGAYKALPVEQEEKVVGVLGRMDVLASLERTGVVVGNVREHMSTPAVAIEETANLAQARAKMLLVRMLNVAAGGKEVVSWARGIYRRSRTCREPMEVFGTGAELSGDRDEHHRAGQNLQGLSGAAHLLRGPGDSGQRV